MRCLEHIDLVVAIATASVINSNLRRGCWFEIRWRRFVPRSRTPHMTQHPSTNSMSYAEENIESRLSLLDLGDGGISVKEELLRPACVYQAAIGEGVSGNGCH